MPGMEVVSRIRNHRMVLDLGGGGRGMHGVDDATGQGRPSPCYYE